MWTFLCFLDHYTVWKILQKFVMQVAVGSDPSICKKRFFFSVIPFSYTHSNLEYVLVKILMKNGCLLTIFHEFIMRFVWTKNFY